jgi:crotonobetainyl-CoA:carnitine CoA-transferase CaiB-like acyl-CoA transferase
MIAAGNDNLFRKLCGALALGSLAFDPDYATNAARVVNRARLIPQIEAAASEYSVDALGKLLDAAGVPNAPLLSVDQVATHPQTKSLEMTIRCSEDDIDLVGVPLSFNGARPRARTPAPVLGQHNALFEVPSPKEVVDAK